MVQKWGLFLPTPGLGRRRGGLGAGEALHNVVLYTLESLDSSYAQ